jgi:hypothetical protein
MTNFTASAKPLIGRVWELPRMAHERADWVRHMFAPDTFDLAGYLADRLPDEPIG